MEKIISLIVADDHQIFLEGLILLFEKLSWVNLVGNATNGTDTLSLIESLKPDIALVDLSMKGSSISDIIEMTEYKNISTKVIALTMLNDAFKATQLLQLGLHGYVVKDNAFEDLLGAIQEVEKGGQFISPCLIEEVRELEKKSSDNNLITMKLTNREQEILKYVINGDLNKQIANTLGIKERTVCFHLTNCFIKFGVSNRTQAASFAVQHRLFE